MGWETSGETPQPRLPAAGRRSYGFVIGSGARMGKLWRVEDPVVDFFAADGGGGGRAEVVV